MIRNILCGPKIISKPPAVRGKKRVNQPTEKIFRIKIIDLAHCNDTHTCETNLLIVTKNKKTFVDIYFVRKLELCDRRSCVWKSCSNTLRQFVAKTFYANESPLTYDFLTYL